MTAWPRPPTPAPRPRPSRQRRGHAARRGPARRRGADHGVARAQHARVGVAGGPAQGRRRHRAHRLRAQPARRRAGVVTQPARRGDRADDHRADLPADHSGPDRVARPARLPADARPVRLPRRPEDALLEAIIGRRPDGIVLTGSCTGAGRKRLLGGHPGRRDLGLHDDADRHAGRFLARGGRPRGGAVPAREGRRRLA